MKSEECMKYFIDSFKLRIPPSIKKTLETDEDIFRHFKENEDLYRHAYLPKKVFEYLNNNIPKGIDCSELCEEFLKIFDGESELFLSKDYKKGKTFKITDKEGNIHDYTYHYAFLYKGVVYDILLNYNGVPYSTYIEMINIKGETERSITADKQLKSYC